jgi:hypothetical protein
MEASMRTGFGLKYIYQFLNVPFLQLERENLMQQLETNAKEMDGTCEELEQQEQCIDEHYERFAETLNAARRREQEKQAPQEVLRNAKTVEEAKRAAQEREQKERELTARLAAQPINLNADDPKLIVNQIITKINSKIQQHVSSSMPPPSSSNSNSNLAGAASSSTNGTNGQAIKLDPSRAANMSSNQIQSVILAQQRQQQQQQQQQQTVKTTSSAKTATVGNTTKSGNNVNQLASHMAKLAVASSDDHNSELNMFLNENDPFRYGIHSCVSLLIILISFQI